jgi:hypothetical protein
VLTRLDPLAFAIPERDTTVHGARRYIHSQYVFEPFLWPSAYAIRCILTWTTRRPLAVRFTVEQHVQHEERQRFPRAEVALAGQLEDFRDERQDIKNHLLGEPVGSGRWVLVPHGRPWHRVTRDAIQGDYP